LQNGSDMYREYKYRVTFLIDIIAQSESEAEDYAWDKVIDLGERTEILGIERA
jgi:hypothetical protein